MARSGSNHRSLFDQIGESIIDAVIIEFYDCAFEDPIIGHFFFNHNKASLVQKQQEFAKAMLGGPTKYSGKNLRKAHEKIPVKTAHFDRRQVLMRQVLAKHSLDDTLAKSWLELEEKLKPVIVSSSC